MRFAMKAQNIQTKTVPFSYFCRIQKLIFYYCNCFD